MCCEVIHDALGGVHGKARTRRARLDHRMARFDTYVELLTSCSLSSVQLVIGQVEADYGIEISRRVNGLWLSGAADPAPSVQRGA